MRSDVAAWLERRTWDSRQTPSTSDLAAAKGARSVTLIVPTLNEEGTIGSLVEAVRADPAANAVVDEMVVVDGGSGDRTVARALDAGARVLRAADIEPERAGGGKGGAIWRALLRTTGDLVVLVDADLDPFDASVVVALAAPLLLDDSVHLVKAAAARPLVVGGVEHPGSGGRVTELVARPLLNALWPQLAGVAQPLSGELAARRDLLERIPFAAGYGLEIGMLVDALDAVGLDGIGQVVLGRRTHRHQSDVALGRMASVVLRTALARCGITELPESLLQFARDETGWLVPTVTQVPVVELPPVASIR